LRTSHIRKKDHGTVARRLGGRGGKVKKLRGPEERQDWKSDWNSTHIQKKKGWDQQLFPNFSKKIGNHPAAKRTHGNRHPPGGVEGHYSLRPQRPKKEGVGTEGNGDP